MHSVLNCQNTAYRLHILGVIFQFQGHKSKKNKCRILKLLSASVNNIFSLQIITNDLEQVQTCSLQVFQSAVKIKIASPCYNKTCQCCFNTVYDYPHPLPLPLTIVFTATINTTSAARHHNQQRFYNIPLSFVLLLVVNVTICVTTIFSLPVPGQKQCGQAGIQTGGTNTGNQDMKTFADLENSA